MRSDLPGLSTGYMLSAGSASQLLHPAQCSGEAEVIPLALGSTGAGQAGVCREKCWGEAWILDEPDLQEELWYKTGACWMDIWREKWEGKRMGLLSAQASKGGRSPLLPFFLFLQERRSRSYDISIGLRRFRRITKLVFCDLDPWNSVFRVEVSKVAKARVGAWDQCQRGACPCLQQEAVRLTQL